MIWLGSSAKHWHSPNTRSLSPSLLSDNFHMTVPHSIFAARFIVARIIFAGFIAYSLSENKKRHHDSKANIISDIRKTQELHAIGPWKISVWTRLTPLSETPEHQPKLTSCGPDWLAEVCKILAPPLDLPKYTWSLPWTCSNTRPLDSFTGWLIR